MTSSLLYPLLQPKVEVPTGSPFPQAPVPMVVAPLSPRSVQAQLSPAEPKSWHHLNPKHFLQIQRGAPGKERLREFPDRHTDTAVTTPNELKPLLCRLSSELFKRVALNSFRSCWGLSAAGSNQGPGPGPEPLMVAAELPGRRSPSPQAVPSCPWDNWGGNAQRNHTTASSHEHPPDQASRKGIHEAVCKSDPAKTL